jgi:UDP-N-acetylmuramyl pentapeptide phosphotransferase/UDP-N-acetylglucosamine-1-phosphate transferase
MPARSLGRASALVAAAAAAAGGAATWAARGRAPGGDPVWGRTNHRGEQVTLWEGPAYAAAATAGVLLAPGLAPRVRAAAALATAGAAAFGALDDLAERGSSKGFRGHLGSLARGELTTGAVKILGIGATGVLAAAGLLERPSGRGRVRHLVDVVVAGGVVAGTANLGNLLDLRPGRVLKLVLATAPAAATGSPAAVLSAAAAGATLPLLRPDLAERSMLGDCGANAAGALVGTGAVLATGDRGGAARAGLLAALVALTLLSEKVSFTRLIEATPVLRELDALGRRPAATGS